MKRQLSFACTLFGFILLPLSPVAAQLPAGDLRLWLKADSLNIAEDAQVLQWVDSSSHGTIFSPRTMGDADAALGAVPIEENPHLQTVTLGGKTFKTVKFERDGSIFNTGDPNVDRSGSTDRLYQVNNRTPGSDPLAIGDGTSVTSFTVFKPNVTSPPTLGGQAIWAKRGNSASLLELGIANTPNPAGRFLYVTYDANTVYIADNKAAKAGAFHILEQSILENGATDNVSFLVNDTEIATNPLVNLSVTNGGVIADRNDGINEDPAGLVEPFGIGGHAQDCCGEGETFAGNIAEIIIYAGALSQGDKNQIYQYLANKYLPVPEPSCLALATVALLGAVALRRRSA